MCAPVSPPVVVVLEKSRLGWSCQRVTAITAPMVRMVMAPGTHHRLPPTSAHDEVFAFEGGGGRGTTRCPLVGVRWRPVG